jgi:hypothetical protein
VWALQVHRLNAWVEYRLLQDVVARFARLLAKFHLVRLDSRCKLHKQQSDTM